MLPFCCIQWLITLLVCIFMWQYWNFGTRIRCRTFSLQDPEVTIGSRSMTILAMFVGARRIESHGDGQTIYDMDVYSGKGSTPNIISFAARPWKLYSMNFEISIQHGSLILVTNTGTESSCVCCSIDSVCGHRIEERTGWIDPNLIFMRFA